MPLTDNEKAEITQIVKESTQEVIHETFKVLGVDVEDFDHINEFRENLRWVRKYRKASETVGSRILITLTTIATGGILTAIWAYMNTRGG